MLLEYFPPFIDLVIHLKNTLAYYVSVKTAKYTEWCSPCTHRAYSCDWLKAMEKILWNSPPKKEKCISPSFESWQACNFLWPMEWDRSVSFKCRFQETLQEHSCFLVTLLPCEQAWASPLEGERQHGAERESSRWGSPRLTTTSWAAKWFQRSAEPARTT